jgi:4-amino-4-deoxy-L-arabinose transferase-like glycosyltransferase
VGLLTRIEERGSRRRFAYILLALATVVPRLLALLTERGDILEPFTFGEKSDDIARTFLDSGTFGFIPDLPTAYTQPLYSFFLIPLYAAFGRSWEVVGGAQILVALATALIVYEIGRRWISVTAGIGGALLTTLHPYMIWHDVHVNREVLDGLLAAAIVFLTLVLTNRRSAAIAAALGVTVGLAILGNVRLIALPLVLVAYLLWQWRVDRRSLAVAAVSLATCAAVLAPWVVRNNESVGCIALTTDARALWEANNPGTLATLRAGLFLDNVPLPRAFPPSAQDAGREYRRHGNVVRVDECKQMRFYQGEVLDFWREQPGEKVRLAGQATLMLWSPSVTPAEANDTVGRLGWLRTAIEPAYMLPLFALAVLGLWWAPRKVAVLSLALLGYQWAMAMVFVGATRYRVSWDFLIALLAATALAGLLARFTTDRAPAAGS